MLDRKYLKDLQEYVESNLIELELFSTLDAAWDAEELICNNSQSLDLEHFIKENRKPTFNQVLFSFIDREDSRDSDIYKRAGIDRRHFGKIRNNPDYRIGKNTAVALALALELNKKETDKLLSAAGFSLSNSNTFDLIIQFCLEKKIYNIHDVNQALDHFSLKPLIGVLE